MCGTSAEISHPPRQRSPKFTKRSKSSFLELFEAVRSGNMLQIWSNHNNFWSPTPRQVRTCERIREGHYLVLQAEGGTPPTRSWFLTENISATTGPIFLLFDLKLFSVSSLTRPSTFFGAHAATELRKNLSLKNKCRFCLCTDSMLAACCSIMSPRNFRLPIKFAFRRRSQFSGF